MARRRLPSGTRVPLVVVCTLTLLALLAPALSRLGSGRAIARAAAPVMVVEQAASADSFVGSIGVNVHLNYLRRVYGVSFATIVKPRLAELGVRHLRDNGDVLADSAWMRLVYGRYREIAALGPRFTLVVRPLGGLAGDYGSAEHLSALVNWLGREHIEAIEGLNELDAKGLPDWPQRVRSFQRAIWSATRRDPALRGIPVLGPTFARRAAAARVGDLSAYMDGGAVHSYAGGGTPRQHLAANLRSCQAVSGDRPLYVTEAGYHTSFDRVPQHAGVSELAMGKYLPRLMLDHFGAGVVRTFQYELLDEGTDEDEIEQNFGLLRHDGSPKPAFIALRNMIALLADPGPPFAPGRLSYSLAGDTSGVRRALFAKRDGRAYLVLWLDVPSYDAARGDLTVRPRRIVVRLATPPAAARVYLPLESAQGRARVERPVSIAVDVPDHPLIIELDRPR